LEEQQQQQQPPRKVYTREFKLEAVRLSMEPGRTVVGVARELGISDCTLHKWRQELRADPTEAFPGSGRLKPQEEELRRLRRALQRAEQERDFLKKAALWLAQEAHRSTGS
jgi:transposase